MSFVDPPAAAAWHHHDARDGFEVTFFRRAGRGRRVEGTVTGVEDGQAWAVSYAVEVAAPAAYVRLGLRVDRQEQTHRRVAAAGPGHRYDYAAPGLGFRCRLVYDTAGLVLSYPGPASRRSTGQAPAP